ncbi:MAG: hypothetical protein ACXWDN_00555 [Limisphaerales bacterium]
MNGQTSVSTTASGWNKGAEETPKAQVLRSLGKLVRGLSALFWSLPFMLIIFVQTARTDWLQNFRAWAMLPAIAISALLWWSLMQLRQFQPQERIWRQAVDRAEVFSIINLGLSPFLYWFHEMPMVPLYIACVSVLCLSSLLLIIQLNRVLQRLAAMLPDETLRAETKLFAGFNTLLLVALLGVVAIYFGLEQMYSLPAWVDKALDFVAEQGPWIILFVILIPMALTMALIWKTKELIFASVFNAER